MSRATPPPRPGLAPAPFAGLALVLLVLGLHQSAWWPLAGGMAAAAAAAWRFTEDP